MAAGGIKAGQAYVELFANETPLERGLRKAEYQLRMFANQMTALGARLFGMGMAGSVPLWMSAKHFAELDDSLRLVKAVTGATEKEFDKLSEKARYLGRTTSFTSKQVADAMGELGRAGFKTREIDNMIEHVMNLSRATQTSIPIAANAAAAALRQFGMDSTETGRVVDVMTAAANNSAQTLEDIAVSFRYAAPVAKEFNMTIEDTAKLVGALANQGLRNEMAGTTLRNLMARIGSDDVQAKFKEIGVELRKDGVVRPISEILHDVGIQMNKLNMDALQRAEWFHRAFGLRSMAGGSKLVSQVFNDLNEALDNAADTAARTAHEMDAGLGGTFRLLISAVQGLMEAVGEALVGTLQEFGKWAMDTINRFTDWIKLNQEFVVSLGETFALMTAVGGGLLALSATINTISTVFGALISTLFLFLSPAGAVLVLVGSFVAYFLQLSGVLDLASLKLKLFGQQYESTMKTAVEQTKRHNEEADRMIRKLETLQDAPTKSPDIMKDMVDTVNELNNCYGDLGLSVDTVTGKVNGLAEAHDKLSEAQRKALLLAHKNAKAEASKNYQTASDVVENEITGILSKKGRKNPDLIRMEHGYNYDKNLLDNAYIKWTNRLTGRQYYVAKYFGMDRSGKGGEKWIQTQEKTIDRALGFKTQEEAEDKWIDLYDSGGPAKALDNPSIGASSMTPWVLNPTDRSGPDELVAEYVKMLDKGGKAFAGNVGEEYKKLKDANDQLDSLIQDQASAFNTELERYNALPQEYLAETIFKNDFLGKFGFFAGQFRTSSVYTNPEDFTKDTEGWIDQLETAFSNEQDEDRKKHIATYIDLFKKFRTDFAEHLAKGGTTENFDMVPYGDLFAYMANVAFVKTEQDALKDIRDKQSKFENDARAEGLEGDQYTNYVNERLNPIKEQWSEILKPMATAKELNAKYSALTQSQLKKDFLNNSFQALFNENPEIGKWQNYIESNTGTPEEQRIRAIEKQADENLKSLEEEIRISKETGRTGRMNNGQWEEVFDWDQWGEDQKKRINDIKDKQIAEIKASIDEPMADAIQGAWETGTTEYDQRLSDLNSQIADVIMRRRSAAVSGNWGALESLDWEQKQLEYAKAQTEYNRAIAYSSYVEKQRAQAVTDYNQALKTYKDTENLPDNDPAKVAASKALNTAKENLGKWDRDVESATDSIDRTASQLNRLVGMGDVMEEAYKISQSTFSSLGTFNPFEMGNFGQTTIRDELKEQTVLLSDIRDNTELLGDGAWL